MSIRDFASSFSRSQECSEVEEWIVQIAALSTDAELEEKILPDELFDQLIELCRRIVIERGLS